MELGSHSESDCLSLQLSTPAFPDSVFRTLFRTAVKSAPSMAQPDSVPHSGLKCPLNGTTGLCSSQQFKVPLEWHKQTVLLTAV